MFTDIHNKPFSEVSHNGIYKSGKNIGTFVFLLISLCFDNCIKAWYLLFNII